MQPNEEVRLKHRPLDLRRPSLQRALALRSQAAHAARTYLLEHAGTADVPL